MMENFQQRKKVSIRIFNIIKSNFPFVSKKEINKFESKFNILLKKISKLKKDEDKKFFFELEKFVDILKNSHTRLNKIKTKSLKKKNKSRLLKNFIKSKILKKKIGYIQIKSWSNNIHGLPEEIERIFINLYNKEIRSLIIDVRDNQGGDSKIAQDFCSHFFNKKVLFSIIKQRIPAKKIKFKKSYSYILPKKPYFKKPVIILINNKCFSSNEYFIAGMKDNKRALLVGEKTAGGSGNPKRFIIPYKDCKLGLFVSSWIFKRINNKLLEGRGIKPHIIIKQKGKKDLALKKAIMVASNMARQRGRLT